MTESACWVAVTPAKAADNAWERPMCSSRPRSSPFAALSAAHSYRTISLDHLQQALDHLIGSRHDARVGRIGLLRHDQVAELSRDVDVGSLDRAAFDRAGMAIDRRTRSEGGRIGTAVERLQGVLTVEGCKRDLRQRNGLAIRERAGDLVLAVDRNRLQLAGGETILLELADLCHTARIGELGEAVGAEIEDR